MLAVLEDGNLRVWMEVGEWDALENASRIARPGDKLCTCGLETEEQKGLSRTITTALPEPLAAWVTRVERPTAAASYSPRSALVGDGLLVGPFPGEYAACSLDEHIC